MDYKQIIENELEWLTVTAFAKKIGVTRQSLHGYRTGKIKPSYRILVRLYELAGKPLTFHQAEK